MYIYKLIYVKIFNLDKGQKYFLTVIFKNKNLYYFHYLFKKLTISPYNYVLKSDISPQKFQNFPVISDE